jgi:hypothetical protein
MYLHTGGEEEESTKRVSGSRPGRKRSWPNHGILNEPSAKYIEGLENRLGRMESLLRLSGLLSEEDGGATDLGTLEKKLADRSSRMSHDPNGTSSKRNSTPGLAMDASSPGSEQNDESEKSPTAQGSPKPPEKRKSDEEVEVLSDMMCSLVTNNCGETRYIGESHPQNPG